MKLERFSELRQPAGLPARQRGIALIMVLLAFALATALAAGMYTSQQLMIYKASHYLDEQQARSLARGAEDFARQMLKQDWTDDKKNDAFVDDNSENWAKYAATLPVDNGVVQVQIDDLQGRFNLNNLVTAAGKPDATAQKRFENLLAALDITSVTVQKVIDWEDANQEPMGAMGAEDDAYLGLSPPYRAANGPFASITELRLIAGMTDKDYRKLLPYVAALPMGQTDINVNTAAAPVLRTLSPQITDAQAQSILQQRKDKPFKTVQDFLAQPQFAGLGLKSERLSVNSYFFRIAIRVTLGDQVYRQVSRAYRGDDGKVMIISRDQGQKAIITKPAYQIGQ